MSADHLIGIEKFEAHLWKMADTLRSNTNLASNEYFLPVLGLIFLRHATPRHATPPAASARREPPSRRTRRRARCRTAPSSRRTSSGAGR